MHFLVFIFVTQSVFQVAYGYLQNHTFVFISGWPQSGTSFLNQIFSVTPNASTMVEKCDKIIGAKCLNWNHEGQWLLKASSELTKLYNPGAMCPCSHDISKNIKSLVQTQWAQFWSLDSSVLVEKSPQNLLKMSFLRAIFSTAKSIKFIVVVKHPVTLNIATPKDYRWTSHDLKISQQGDHSSKQQSKSVDNTVDQMNANVRHFIEFLSHNTSDAEGRSCSLGWLPALETLVKNLKGDNRSNVDVRILRYEEFQVASVACRALFSFVFDLDLSLQYQTAVADVCNVHFPHHIVSARKKVPLGPLSAGVINVPQSIKTNGIQSSSSGATSQLASSSRFRSHLGSRVSTRQLMEESLQLPVLHPGLGLMETISESTSEGNNNYSRHSDFTFEVRSHNRREVARRQKSRSLRLKIEKGTVSQGGLANKEGSISLNFRPELVGPTGLKRFHEFQQAVGNTRGDLQRSLWALENRLLPFGYSLKSFDVYRRQPTVLDEWDLMKWYYSQQRASPSKGKVLS